MSTWNSKKIVIKESHNLSKILLEDLAGNLEVQEPRLNTQGAQSKILREDPIAHKVNKRQVNN